MTTAPTLHRVPAATRRPQSGPPLLVPVLSFAVLTIAYVVFAGARRRAAAAHPSDQPLLTLNPSEAMS